MSLDPRTHRRLAALKIDPDDLEEQFSRSGGPGGQHANKVETSVTIVHRPSGLRASASDSRSQATNREMALERLLELFETRRAEARQEHQAEASRNRARKNRRSQGQKRRMVEQKRRRTQVKKMRRRPPQ